ncbi:MAG: hypothetical protein GVY17_00295 [Cyanobacteria bacterium]|nr:hypothetical protein [Cyanobacteria bacterium GSL.Bin21]
MIFFNSIVKTILSQRTHLQSGYPALAKIELTACWLNTSRSVMTLVGLIGLRVKGQVAFDEAILLD